ncbi:MAG: hypothetical protein IH851_13685 [Armatimonadetes bacterium]|nr:hypothetical protein [Armatimonadota bacterium]
MERYTGRPLPEAPKIALTANDALGNFAVCTPLAQALRHFHPGCRIDFYGGERTAELERASARLPLGEGGLGGDDALFEWRASLHGRPFAAAAREALRRRDEIGGYDLVINVEAAPANRSLAALIGEGAFVCGPSLAPDSRGEWDFPDDERGDLWREKRWVDEDLPERYSFLETGFISELFIRLAYMGPIPDAPWTGGIPRYCLPSEEPGRPIPELLISTGATLPKKLWPVSKWRELLTWTREQGMKAGLLGAPPKRQQEFYHSDRDEQALVDEDLVEDLRGKLSLPQVVGALSRARLVITIDNGILHFAAANDVTTIGLYRRGFDRLWSPPNPNLARLTPETGDVASIETGAVFEKVETALSGCT